MSVTVERVLFDFPALEALESLPELVLHVPDDSLPRPLFNVSPSTEGDTASLALGLGIIGVVVGKREDGAAALWAFESNVDLIA